MTLAALGWNERRQKDFAPYADAGLLPGRVVSEHRSHYQVATQSGEIAAEITGRLRQDAGLRSDLPGTGDFVAVRLAAVDGNATIEAVLPRSSALIRKASGEPRPQLIAANVDTVFIVMGLDADYNIARLERYLALVQASGAVAVVVASKTDLASDAATKIAVIRAAASGVAVHPVNAKSGDMGELERYFDGGGTVALVGSSGAGKSTLTNRLIGADVQATQSVRIYDSRGRHTTTHRQLFLRPGGGSIMDTPGMRGLEQWTASDEHVVEDFEDIEGLSLQCRFNNCRHEQEPGCAVRAALERGELAPDRLALYIARDTPKPRRGSDRHGAKS